MPATVETKEADTVTVPMSIDEAAWTVQEPSSVIIDRPQDWPTQDYVNDPPPQVTWEHPYDSI